MGFHIALETGLAEGNAAVQQLAELIDDESLVLNSGEAIPDGEWVAFEVKLADGTVFFEGMGRCEGSASEGGTWDVLLGELQLDTRNELIFERILLARDSLEDGRPSTGLHETPEAKGVPVPKLSSLAKKPPPPVRPPTPKVPKPPATRRADRRPSPSFSPKSTLQGHVSHSTPSGRPPPRVAAKPPKITVPKPMAPPTLATPPTTDAAPVPTPPTTDAAPPVPTPSTPASATAAPAPAPPPPAPEAPAAEAPAPPAPAPPAPASPAPAVPASAGPVPPAPAPSTDAATTPTGAEAGDAMRAAEEAAAIAGRVVDEPSSSDRTEVQIELPPERRASVVEDEDDGPEQHTRAVDVAALPPEVREQLMVALPTLKAAGLADTLGEAHVLAVRVGLAALAATRDE